MKRSEVKVTTSSVDTVVIPHDAVNEQIVIAAAMADDELRDKLISKIKPDAMLTPLHRQIWTAFSEMARRHLAYDPGTVQQLIGSGFDPSFLISLSESRPDAPPNLDYHVENVLWDHARLKSVTGPIAHLLECLKDNRTAPEKVRGLARAVAASFDGYADRRYMRDGAEVVREQVQDIRERMFGRACYPFGIEALDRYEAGHAKAGEYRLIPGCKPGKISVICGVPGGGKSTFTAALALGLVRQRKRVLFGAWEMDGGEILELMACQDLGISRHDVSIGNVTEETLEVLRTRMDLLREFITFLDIPFNRAAGEKKSNDHNLDIVQGYIADSGCDVFIADLWKRCLRYTDPDDEEQALVRQQAMAKELNVHCILVQQLRAKDVESRADKRPTRESIKGSGAWIEVPDNIIGIHRPGLWKNIPDDHIDAIILKQRFGPWPLVVQFGFSASRGAISGGVTVPYLHEAPKTGDGDFLDEEDGFGGKRRRG